MKLVGLIGRARVGKDTVAEHLRLKHGFDQYAFAEPMKVMLEAVFGDLFREGDRELPIDWLGKSPRHLLQTLGTEWGRTHIHPEVWIMLVERKVRECKNREQDLVISDVRFHDEAALILRNGGELWHIERDNAEGVNAHVSESHQWDNYRRVIIPNNGTIEALFSQIDRLGLALAA